jgi:hypothetical protein
MQQTRLPSEAVERRPASWSMGPNYPMEAWTIGTPVPQIGLKSKTEDAIERVGEHVVSVLEK